MGKKLQWIYLGIYCATMLYLIVAAGTNGGILANALIQVLILFFPAAVVAIELRGKKVPVLITLAALLLVLVMFLGTINFNGLAADVVFKAALLAIMLVLLGIYAYKRLFKKSASL